MDFIDWCTIVLQALVKEERIAAASHPWGVQDDDLAQAVFGEVPPLNATHWKGLASALCALEEVGLIERTPKLDSFTQSTRQGRQAAQDITPLWEAICSIKPESDEEILIDLVNRVSVQSGDDHSWLEFTDINGLAQSALGVTNENLPNAVVKELKDQGLVKEDPWLHSGHLGLQATYRSLAWQTRCKFIGESRFIEQLRDEWETTSVDFKRELNTGTKDEKAEFIKDVLGLVNTQASGRRWMIIGFDPKTREYHSPPQPKLTQDHLEQLLSQYTAPNVEIRYQVMQHYEGPVGVLEMLRQREKLPYRVAKSLAGAKRQIRAQQAFVRHGSQTVMPGDDELASLQAEGDRARAAS